MIDIEELLVEYLSECLDVPVAADVPENTDELERFVSLERTGGAFDSIVLDHPTVAIQCWATTRKHAKDLVYRVDELVRAMPDVYYNVADATRNSLYNFPDINTRKPRYQLVVDFIIQQ